MYKKLVTAIFFIYQGLRSFRYILLYSFFGQVTHCKHSESCGSYFFRQLREKGMVLGSVKGILRVAQCW
jgi:putative component of membrane protein insertase Oxa1/YidC/SpoIIIJ protein YidD